MSLSFKNRTCWQMSIYVSRKGQIKSQLLLFVLKIRKNKVTWWDSVSHASRHSNTAPRRQSFHWTFHSNVSLHNSFHRYHKCILTNVHFGFPSWASCQYCILACFYASSITMHVLDKSSSLFWFWFLIFKESKHIATKIERIQSQIAS